MDRPLSLWRWWLISFTESLGQRSCCNQCPPLRPTKKNLTSNLLHSPIPPSHTRRRRQQRRPSAAAGGRGRGGGRGGAGADAPPRGRSFLTIWCRPVIAARAAVVTHSRTQSRQPSPSPAAQCAVGAGCAARTASAAAPIGGVVRCGQAQQPRGARRVSAHLFGLHWPAISKFSDPLRHHA